MDILTIFGKAFIAGALALGGVFGVGTAQAPAQPAYGDFNPSGGTTYRLASSIGTTDTSIRLSSFKEPVSDIPYTMSYLNTEIGYGTLDPNVPGRSEFISFTGITQNSNGTAILTGVTRGLARSPGASATGCTVASSTLRQSHSGQSIFILSDSPCFFSEYAVKRNDETITGNWTVDGQWTFATFPITPNNGTSSETVAGVVQLGTGAQAAASNQDGSTGARTVIPTSISTSTWSSAISTNVVPVTNTSGKLDSNFIATSTLFAAPILGGGTTVFGSSTITAYTSSTTPSTTWTKPANLKFAIVEVIGAGGGGGGCTETGRSAGGGGGGGYGKKIIPAAALGATETIVVPTGGTGGAAGAAGGTNAVSAAFGSHVTVTNGSGGSVCAATVSNGGAGGVSTGGDINIVGGVGGRGASDAGLASGLIAIGGNGGSTPFGFGAGINAVSSTNVNPGEAGGQCGGGGSGAVNANSANDAAGGAGGAGCVIITAVYY